MNAFLNSVKISFHVHFNKKEIKLKNINLEIEKEII